MENWKKINEKYQVSDMGNVKRTDKNRMLKLGVNNSGYYSVYVGRRAFVHRLVALAFVPNPEGKTEVNHKNGIKTDNRATNLEWVTRSENLNHRYNALGIKGVNYGRKLSPEWKAKLSASAKGRPKSEAWRKKITEMNRRRAEEKRAGKL